MQQYDDDSQRHEIFQKEIPHLKETIADGGTAFHLGEQLPLRYFQRDED